MIYTLISNKTAENNSWFFLQLWESIISGSPQSSISDFSYVIFFFEIELIDFAGSADDNAN